MVAQTVQTTSNVTNKDRLLRSALQADALFSAVGGAITIVTQQPLAQFFGVASPLPFLILGVVMLVYAADVYWVSSRPTVQPTLTAIIVALNAVWVLASWAILVTDMFSLSSGGRWTILIVADAVLAFGIAEAVGLRRMQKM